MFSRVQARAVLTVEHLKTTNQVGKIRKQLDDDYVDVVCGSWMSLQETQSIKSLLILIFLFENKNFERRFALDSPFVLLFGTNPIFILATQMKTMTFLL